MTGPSLIFVILPVVIPGALLTCAALPLAAGRRRGHGQVRRRPDRPRPATHDVAARFLYVPCVRACAGGTRRWVQPVPVVKRTAKRIYYTSETWDRGAAVVSPGCISRERFETDTRSRGRARGHPAGVIPIPGDHRHGPAGRLFFATREAAEADLYRGSRRAEHQRPVPATVPPARITELRRAMIEAHPDRGGTAERFIRARWRYETALGQARR